MSHHSGDQSDRWKKALSRRDKHRLSGEANRVLDRLAAAPSRRKGLLLRGPSDGTSARQECLSAASRRISPGENASETPVS
jgi:hypothetical protein